MQPFLLWALAAVTIATGLFIWLGGFGFKKAMFVLTGLFCGASCMLFYSDTNPFLAVAITGIFAMIAFKLQDIFFALMASVVFVAAGYLILIRPCFRPSSDILAVIRQLAIGVPYYNWVILLAAAALPFAVMPVEGISSLFSSAVGTTLMATGTFMVLANAGYPVVSNITVKEDIFLAALALVITAGVIIQLWLLPKINTRFAAVKNAVKAKVKADKGDAAKAAKTTSWRTA